MNAFGRAWNRLASGLIGTWCLVGPLLLAVGWSDSARDNGLATFILVLLFGCYAGVIWKCRKYGLGYLRWLGINMLALIGLAVIFGALGGVVAAFTGIEVYRASAFGILAPFLGFWLIEAIRKEPRE